MAFRLVKQEAKNAAIEFGREREHRESCPGSLLQQPHPQGIDGSDICASITRPKTKNKFRHKIQLWSRLPLGNSPPEPLEMSQSPDRLSRLRQERSRVCFEANQHFEKLVIEKQRATYGLN